MSHWDLLPVDIQDKIIIIRNDMIQFSQGLFHFNDILFGNCHILIQSISMFHVFYFLKNKSKILQCDYSIGKSLQYKDFNPYK